MLARKALLAASAMGLVLTSVPFESAQAQDDKGDVYLEEITVTARRRNEALADVPVSVSVVGERDLSEMVISNTPDLLRQVPGVLAVSGGAEYLADISIRGQGNGRAAFNEAATGLYRNGVSITGGGFGGRSLSKMDLFDAGRVEVYRGPQGALYGRNSVGGAINVVSNRPTDDFSGNIKMGYEGEIDRKEVQGVLNVPLVDDRLAVRVGGFSDDQNGGFVTVAETGEKVDVRNSWGTRAAARFNPSDAATLNLTYEHLYTASPGFAALGYRAAKDGSDPYVRRNLNRAPSVLINEDTVIAELSWDLGFANLSTVAAYKDRFGERLNEDLDHFSSAIPSAASDATATVNEQYTRRAVESRLASPGHGRLRWLFGADLISSDQKSLNNNTILRNGVRADLARSVFTEDLTSYSTYGSLEYDLTEKIELSVEGRYQVDQKDFNLDEQTGGTDLREKHTWRKFLPSATASYALDNASTLYTRFATGYRAGGFNVSVPEGFANKLRYEPESLDSLEGGWRATLFDRKLQVTIATYYTWAKNTLISTQASASPNSTILENAVGSESYGAEGELRYQSPLGPGRLTATLGVTTTSGTFDDGSKLLFTPSGTTVPIIVDIGGLELNRQRDYQLTASLRYAFPLTSSMSMFVFGSYQSEDGGLESQRGNTSGTIPLQGFNLFDARVGLIGDQWGLSVYGRNLTNEVYRLQTVSGNEYYNDRRSYGVEFTYRFGS